MKKDCPRSAAARGVQPLENHALSSRIARWAVIALIASVANNQTVAQSSFTGLGSLNPNYPVSYAAGVSGDGSTVVGASLDGGALNGRAFRWRFEDGMIALARLDEPYDDYAEALGASAKGGVVVGYGLRYSGKPVYPTAGFRWTPDGMIGFPDSCQNSVVHGVSASGAVVVGRHTCRAFRWTESTGMVHITANAGVANAVSGDGSVVVGALQIGDSIAFRWTAADGLQSLGGLPGGIPRSVANDISADGRVIVGQGRASGGDEAFYWSVDSGMVSLGELPGAPGRTEATGVSGDGRIVVGTAAGSTKFFIWDAEHGMRDLRTVLENDYGLGTELKRWRFRSPNGIYISDDGRALVGSGLGPGGMQAWIAHLANLECPGDWNSDGALNSTDFFDFLHAFFCEGLKCRSADFNLDGVENSQDFFDFLMAFFEGCA